MQTFTGHLAKMKVELDDPIGYELRLDELKVPLNPLIGREIELVFDGVIHCVACGRELKKSYQQGYCFPCTQTLAECDLCILKPERCHYHKGTCRQPAWGEEHCLQPHYVYLANSSGLKVGITRAVNIPTRWIDQGATQAIPMLKVGSRLQSGLLEVIFKDHVSDRTDWRKMLRNDVELKDMPAAREDLLDTCMEALAEFEDRYGADALEVIEDDATVELQYPVRNYPSKIKSLNFDKTPTINGILEGIKGQYLILSSGVLNIRKFSGYEITINM